MRPFELERWYVEYEFDVKNNISASCATPCTTRELLDLAGAQAAEDYLNLGLDYIPNPGTPKLREAIAGWYDKIGSGEVQVTTGASEAIVLLMQALVGPGDVVVALSPAYQSLHEVALSLGAEVRPWPLREGGPAGYSLDLDELRRLAQPGTKAIIVNFPHNPTGFMASPGEQREIVRIAEEIGAALISDEVYRGLVHDPADRLPAAADLSESAVSIGDMTKPFGLGGLRVGWLATKRREILDSVSALRDYTTMCSAGPSEFLATIALNHREQLLSAKLAIARENLARFHALAARHADVLYATMPKGGVTVFPQYDLPISSREFCEGLIREESVLLLPGYVYGVEKHFRIGLSQPGDRLEDGLSALDRYLTKLKAG
jgi:aspartate/methionine/tyrosine aminotransferase